jgi:putative membrane protein insertion efficiency factor
VSENATKPENSCCDGEHSAPALDVRVSPLGRLLIFFVMIYRVTLSRVMGGQCRFHPTCSQYMIDAIRIHGALRGGWRGIKRIGRCHPWGGSGYDPA